jgi:Mrp family chromosome partitioning ATPase
MSKNFELMQQISKGYEVAPSQFPEPTVAGLDRNGHDGGQSAGEEALRLVQRLFLLQTAETPRVVVFAGIDHGNGCSQICASVAETLAKNTPGSVCLLEANFRSSSLPAFFGTTNHHGFADALLREGPIRSFAKQVSRDNLWLISSGSLAADSPNPLGLGGVKNRIAELRSEFDFVIIDAPPLTRYADAISLGQLTDGLVLVLEANSTRREAAVAAAESLRSSQIKILGAVLNKRTFPIPESIYSRL